MDEFIYKAPYEEEGKRILEVNILPETYCSFNCIYCPIDRKEDRHQTDEIQDLGDVTKALDDWAPHGGRADRGSLPEWSWGELASSGLAPYH